MNNILIKDVCEAYIKDIASSTAYFFGLTTKNEVTQKLKQDVLKAGIGNGVVGVIQSDKEMGFKVTTLLHNDDLVAMQVGKAFASGSYTVQNNETVKCVSGKLTITGTPKSGATPLVKDAKGADVAGTFATSDFTITAGAVEGAYYTVIYPVDVTGTILDLDSKSFPKNYYVELHTIGYDVDTNEVVCDIYWVFDKALPNGSLTEAYEAGKQQGNDIEFTAQLLTGASSYGKYIVIPRA